LAELAFLMHQAEEELELQARIIKGRELFAGYIDSELATQAADIFLGADESDIEGINLMAIAINTTVRRITLTGFEVVSPATEGEEAESVSPDDKGNSEIKAIQAWIKKFYEVNRIEAISRDLHRATERDGEAFLLIDYDLEYVYPRDPAQVGIAKLFISERYTDAGTTWKNFQGTSEGCKAHYRHGDHNQPLDMVSKRWIEQYWEEEEIKARQRMTLYIAQVGSALVGDLMPARIEKYAMSESGEWEEFRDEGDEEWPIWWTENGTDTGASLPIPVIHFRNEELEPGQKKIWGLQTAMDELWVSFMNAQLMAGHQLLVAFGFYPTTDEQPPAEDGSNLLKVAPRQIIGSGAIGSKEASLTAIQPAPAEPLLQGLDKTAIYASFVGSLPVSNFIFSKAVASSETLKQGDAELVARINELMGLWSFSWSAAMDIARKMEILYGGNTMSELPAIVPQWASPERRDMNHLTKEANAKRSAQVPEVVILQEVWGYSPEQAAAYIKENLSEHQQGIGPEAITILQAQIAGAGAEPEAPTTDEEHGNAASQQLTTIASP
jgi:hypothetical protein